MILTVTLVVPRFAWPYDLDDDYDDETDDEDDLEDEDDDEEEDEDEDDVETWQVTSAAKGRPVLDFGS